MKKTRIAIFALLLLGLLVFSTAQLVSANVGSAVFCPNNVQQVDDATEITLSTNICASIYNMLVAKYQGGCYFANNCSYTTYVGLLSTLQSFNKAVVFSKGHRGEPYLYWNPSSSNHYSLLSHDGTPVIDVTDIFSHTSKSENTFTFIWHCQSADKYPEGITPDYYGVYGMPYCWTHNVDPMQMYSNSGSQVYLGWKTL